MACFFVQVIAMNNRFNRAIFGKFHFMCCEIFSAKSIMTLCISFHCLRRCIFTIFKEFNCIIWQKCIDIFIIDIVFVVIFKGDSFNYCRISNLCCNYIRFDQVSTCINCNSNTIIRNSIICCIRIYLSSKIKVFNCLSWNFKTLFLFNLNHSNLRPIRNSILINKIFIPRFGLI